MNNVLSLSQISLYNTQGVTDEQARLLFVARHNLFELIINSIRGTRRDAPPQHHLIVGQRGMGKTTLLKRLEIELRSEPLCKDYIPLLFPEEQYNLDSLDTFWLNCLDAVADVLEKEGKDNDVAEIDKEVERLSSLSIEARAHKIYPYFRHVVFNLGRRPVLLIDNINFVLGRLSREEQHILRSYMTENYAPIIIGASSSHSQEISNYSAPFYDAFQPHYLKRLTSTELTEILINLANVTGQEVMKDAIRAKNSRLKALNQLTGGNPRTAVILFKQAIKGFSEDITGDLDGILDDLTPIYKARFEELSEKMQIIINYIAMQWDPVTLEQIRRSTQMDNGQISPQLKRLIDLGWIEKPKSARGKGGSYEISERMFNIWYLIRRSSRRQKRIVFCLSKFLEAFYERNDELLKIVESLIPPQLTNDKHAIAALAFARLVDDKETRWKIHEKARDYLITQSQTKPDIFDKFDESDLFDGVEENHKALASAQASNNHERIVFCTKSLLEKDPFNVDLAKIYINSCIQLHLFKDAYCVLNKIDNPELFKTAIDLAVITHDETSYENQLIEEICLKAISLDPSQISGYLFLGQYYSENERFQDAVEIFLKAEEIDPENVHLKGGIGKAYTFLQNYDEAERYLTSFDMSQVESWGNCYCLAMIRIHQEKYAEAEALLKQGFDYRPDAWSLFPWIILAQDKQGKHQESTMTFLEAIEKMTDREMLYAVLQSIYYEEGITELLLTHFVAGMEKRPEDAQLRAFLAQSYFVNNQFVEAKSLLEKTLAQNPQDDYSLLMMGFISLFIDGDAKKAREYVLESSKIKEDSSKYYLLAVIEKEERDFVQSSNYLESALVLEPDNAETQDDLSMLYEYKLNRLDLAEEHVQRAYDIAPGKYVYRLVNFLRDGKKDREAASRYYNAIPEKDRSREWDIIHSIICNWTEGNHVEVHTEMTRSLDYFVPIHDAQTEDHVALPRAYFFAKCIEYGMGELLLKTMEETGFKDRAAPEFYAVAALLSNNVEAYFDTVAHEFREVGLKIARELDFFMCE